MSGEILAEADCRASFSGLEPGTYHFRVENDPFSDGKTFERFETGELPDGGTLKVSADGALEVGQAEKGPSVGNDFLPPDDDLLCRLGCCGSGGLHT